jgi:hypothetical protein
MPPLALPLRRPHSTLADVKKTILIAPFDGPLASALASEASAAGWAIALALARGSEGAAPAPDAGAKGGVDSVTIAYEPRSFVSASALVLAAENAVGPLDAAILVFDPAEAKADFLGAKPGELAALVEERCSGPLFLARELARRFELRRSGRLLLVAPESPRDAALGPAAAMAEGAFEGLGTGLFAAAASSSSWSAYGLRDASGQGDRLARFALEILAEAKPTKSGRWLRYSGKGGIFGQ